jgi:hypothetical protein
MIPCRRVVDNNMDEKKNALIHIFRLRVLCVCMLIILRYYVVSLLTHRKTTLGRTLYFQVYTAPLTLVSLYIYGNAFT